MAGKITKRTDSKGTVTYTTVVSLPRDRGVSTRKQIRIIRSTKREVEAERARILAGYANGEYQSEQAGDKKQTVAEFLTDWLKQASANLKPASAGRYEEIIRIHITPAIGKVQLTRLTPQQVSRLYTTLKDAGLSGSTISNVHTILHKALDQAMRWQLVNRNVTEQVDPPRKGKPEHTIWNSEQVRAFLAVSDKDVYASLWRLAIHTGMRRGEMLGLQWTDVDFAKGALTIKRTYSRGAGNHYEIGSTKTMSGRRQITVAPVVVEWLKTQYTRQLDTRLSQGDDYLDKGFVFADEVGRPIHPNTLTKHFHKLIALASLPSIRIHDLRHTAATLMLSNGEHPKVVSEMLGHANIRITMDLYSHVLPTMQKDASDRLAALIAGTT